MYDYGWNVLFHTVTTLSPHCTGSTYISDSSDCNTAIQYIGSTNIPVYTPACYEGGSSLSHFKDECYVPAGFTPTPPASNNRYLAMSNAGSGGPLYMKRYPKPEERKVLCDIGYSVDTVYGTTTLTEHLASAHRY